MNPWVALCTTICQYLKPSRRPFFFQAGVGRLAALFALAIMVTLSITDDNAIAEMLFQSPASPPAEAPPPQPAPTEPPAPPPAEQPPAQPAPTEAPSPPAAEQPPPQQPPAEPSPTQPPPTATIVFVSPISPAEASPVPPESATSSEPPPVAQPTPIPRSRARVSSSADEDEAASSSNFVVDRIEFVDTLVVSGAYVWLCCGVILLLLLPLIFLFLQIRGQFKIRREEAL